MATREDAGKFSLHPKQSCQSFLIYIHYWEQKINKNHPIAAWRSAYFIVMYRFYLGGRVGERLSQGITKFHASIKDRLLLRPCGARVSPRMPHPAGLYPARLEPNGTEIIEQGWAPARPVGSFHLKPPSVRGQREGTPSHPVISAPPMERQYRQLEP